MSRPAMKTFKNVATQQLGLLWYMFILGTVHSVLPLAIPANACGTELLYQRVVLANYFLVRATIAAAVLLFMVKICVGTAAVEGLSSIAAKWKRVSLRGMLLLAVALSAATSFLAIVIFEDWCQSMSCNAGFGLGSPFSMFMTVAMTLWHGFFAWVAVCKN